MNASSSPIRLRLSLGLAAALLTAVVAGCGGEGTDTDCSLSACTVTFDRGVNASVDVLGVQAELVDVQDDQVTVEVEGQRATLPVGQSTEVEGFSVTVQEVTADSVVVRISRA
jgi:hypothetical protein